MFGAYRFAAAFPGAIFTIPCDRASLYDPANGAPATTLVNEASPGPSPGPTPSIRSRLTSWGDSSTYVAESEYGSDVPSSTASDDSSTDVDDPEHDSDSPLGTASNSSSPDRRTWGRRPGNSDLGPLIDIISAWDMEDAKKMFGGRLRYGNSTRPDIPVPDTRSTARSSRPHPSTGGFGWSMRGFLESSRRLRALQNGGGLVNQAPFIRPDVVPSERVRNLMTASGLRVRTQSL